MRLTKRNALEPAALFAVPFTQPLSNAAAGTRGDQVDDHVSAKSVLTEFALLIGYVVLLAVTPFVVAALALSRFMSSRSRK